MYAVVVVRASHLGAGRRPRVVADGFSTLYVCVCQAESKETLLNKIPFENTIYRLTDLTDGSPVEETPFRTERVGRAEPGSLHIALPCSMQSRCNAHRVVSSEVPCRRLAPRRVVSRRGTNLFQNLC